MGACVHPTLERTTLAATERGPAPPHGGADEWWRFDLSFNPWNSIANLTGNPAMSVPLAWGGSGLPIGLLFTGRYGDEATLFRLAGQLERS